MKLVAQWARESPDYNVRAGDLLRQEFEENRRPTKSTDVTADVANARYRRLVSLLDKWAGEDPAYDERMLELLKKDHEENPL